MIALLILCLAFPIRSAAASPQEPDNGLKIVDVLFEDYHGWLSPDLEMQAGKDVYVTFRVEGFRRLPVERSESGLREGRVRLRYDLKLRDPLGVLVKPEEKGEVDTVLGPRDEEWRPKINWSAPVPSFAPSGDYSVQIHVNDLVANRDATERVLFRVRGESVPTSNSLKVVQLEYARSESGPWYPLRYFSPADPIWARYKIVGYQVSPGKQVWVEQDLTVLDADDNVLVTQANASVEKQQGFYPPRFLSTLFDLTLEDPKPGRYKLRVDVRDKIGQQTSSLESSFFLRP